MGRKRKGPQPSETPAPSGSVPTRLCIFSGLGFALGVLLTTAFYGLLSAEQEDLVENRTHGTAKPETVAKPTSLYDILGMTAKQLETVDVALMNLRCAEGLPGSEGLDAETCLRTLDTWAAHVEAETRRHLYKLHENPAEFDNSEGVFRMMTLITVLQQDFGVRYNEERITDVDFKNAQDLFIHGMVPEGSGGTCVSMPVLYTAVSRRLGYPVKLVTAKAHVLCRWDGPNERFNIEGSGRGFGRYDDDYYKKWPHPIGEAEMKIGHYLQSLTRPQELALFLAARGHCLEDNGRAPEARAAYALAHQCAPEFPQYPAFLHASLRGVRGRAIAVRQPPPRLPTVRRPWNTFGPQAPDPLGTPGPNVPLAPPVHQSPQPLGHYPEQ